MVRTPFLRTRVREGNREHKESIAFVHLDIGSSELRYDKWLLEVK